MVGDRTVVFCPGNDVWSRKREEMQHLHLHTKTAYSTVPYRTHISPALGRRMELVFDAYVGERKKKVGMLNG